MDVPSSCSPNSSEGLGVGGQISGSSMDVPSSCPPNSSEGYG